MIKQTVNFSEFCDSFSDTYKNNFTYEGKRALFDYLENLSEDMGEDIELDTVALCCEYSEFENATECLQQNEYHDAPKEYTDEQALEWLKEQTQVITFENSQGIIIQDF